MVLQDQNVFIWSPWVKLRSYITASAVSCCAQMAVSAPTTALQNCNKVKINFNLRCSSPCWILAENGQHTFSVGNTKHVLQWSMDKSWQYIAWWSTCSKIFVSPWTRDRKHFYLFKCTPIKCGIFLLIIFHKITTQRVLIIVGYPCIQENKTNLILLDNTSKSLMVKNRTWSVPSDTSVPVIICSLR